MHSRWFTGVESFPSEPMSPHTVDKQWRRSLLMAGGLHFNPHQRNLKGDSVIHSIFLI